MIAVAAIAVVSSVAKSKAENKAMRRQEEALNAANKVRAEQIDDQASSEMNERARAVRRARASARATASEAGINLSSGSFLAQLQNFNASEDLEAGLISSNRNNAQKSRDADYKSQLSRISYKTGLGIALDAAGAGLSAYMGAGGTFNSTPNTAGGASTNLGSGSTGQQHRIGTGPA
jgi:hypothetical protein